jgi:2-hydroxychromene-2-carboxylate isomerase
MTSVRFFFDFTSPYTYLATTRVDDLVARTGAEVTWIPVFLAGIMKATGNQPPALVPARGMYMLQDLSRWADFYGVPFRMPANFPVNSLSALRAAAALRAEREERYRAFVDACFRAVWVDGVDLADRANVVALADAADRDLVAASFDDPRWKDAVKKSTDEAVAAGAFGVPSFVVGDDELFFGNDRLDLLARRIMKAR